MAKCICLENRCQGPELYVGSKSTPFLVFENISWVAIPATQARVKCSHSSIFFKVKYTLPLNCRLMSAEPPNVFFPCITKPRVAWSSLKTLSQVKKKKKKLFEYEKSSEKKIGFGGVLKLKQRTGSWIPLILCPYFMVQSVHWFLMFSSLSKYANQKSKLLSFVF